MQAPKLNEKIPPQVINEFAAFGPFRLKNYIAAPDDSPVKFSASLKNGGGLPRGLICTEDGTLTGIPAKGTEGVYEFVIDAENDAGAVQASLSFTIQPAPQGASTSYLDKIKSQVWEALEQNLPVPDFNEIYAREITAADIYYLLERWGVIIIWDAFNLEPPGPKQLLTLEGVSPHYHVYDRGSCLVGSPIDLYSFARTTEDGLITARAMAAEVYRRQWTIEMAGIDKFTRAAWIELQHLSDQHGRLAEVINYSPSDADIRLYSTQVSTRAMRGMEK